jgi:thioesterase domain-containing protein/acyl carrier protein
VAQAVVTVPEQGRDPSSSLTGTERRLAAYLVPKAGTALSVPDLRAFLGSKLPAHMIPSAFVFLDAFPLNPHGKIDRHALARLPGTDSQDRAELGMPGDEIERQLVSLWEEVVGITPIGIRDNFFDLGGHSLLAIRLFARIKEELGVELPIASLFQAPTIEQLAATIRQAGSVPAWSPLVPLQPQGWRPPFYCVHGLGGGVWGYAELAGLLGPEQPLYGLQARGLEGGEPPHTRIEDMAAAYVSEMRKVQPQGPYRLGGYSSGGVVAFEMARLLQAQGEQVGLLALFDSYAPLVPGARRRRWPVLIGFLRNLPRWLADFGRREDRDRRLLARFRGAAQAIWRRRGRDSLPAEVMILNAFGDAAEISDERRRLVEAHLRALETYRPQVYPGRVTLYRVRGMRLFRAEDASLGWEALAGGGVEVRMISGAHYDILQPPAVAALAEELKASLAQVV